VVRDYNIHGENSNKRLCVGIRAPRTARNPSEKAEPYGSEAAEFATRRYMQRDVEIEVDTVDKSGGFIGTLFVNKTENAAITLIKEGLASVHSFSAEGLSWSRQLYDAEASLPSCFTPCYFSFFIYFRVKQNKQSVMLGRLHFVEVKFTNVIGRSGKSMTKKLRK